MIRIHMAHTVLYSAASFSYVKLCCIPTRSIPPLNLQPRPMHTVIHRVWRQFIADVFAIPYFWHVLAFGLSVIIQGSPVQLLRLELETCFAEFILLIQCFLHSSDGDFAPRYRSMTYSIQWLKNRISILCFGGSWTKFSC